MSHRCAAVTKQKEVAFTACVDYCKDWIKLLRLYLHNKTADNGC